MRRRTTAIGLIACLCLLALQMSGLHMHVDDTGYIGTPDSAYNHSHDHHHGAYEHEAHHGLAVAGDTDHERDGITDVSLLDTGLSGFKLPLAIVALFLLFRIFPLVRTLAGPDCAYPVLSGRYTRWRPPLRAPPLSASI